MWGITSRFIERAQNGFNCVLLKHFVLIQSVLISNLAFNMVFVYLQHVTDEGTALVKQAEDAASNKKVGSAISLLFFAILQFFCAICCISTVRAILRLFIL